MIIVYIHIVCSQYNFVVKLATAIGFSAMGYRPIRPSLSNVHCSLACLSSYMSLTWGKTPNIDTLIWQFLTFARGHGNK